MRLLTLITLVALMWACGDQPSPPTGHRHTTPKGASVTVLSGPALDPEAAGAIDAQIDRLLVVSKEVDPKYVFPRHTDYAIDLVAPAPDCGDRISFRTEAGQYGGETICVAGQYFPASNRIRTTLEAVRSTPIVQYEGEHYGLRLNNRSEYERTLTHGNGVYHPILGKE